MAGGLVLATLGSLPAMAADPMSGPAAAVAGASPAASVAYEIGALAGSSTMARAVKEKRISERIREAVIGLGREIKSPEALTKSVVELTAVAAQAAPQFADTIARAAAYAPPMAGIDGARARIRAVAFAGAKSPTPVGQISSDPALAGMSDVALAARYSDAGAAGMPSPDGGHVQLGRNHSIGFTGAISVSHDSNIFLQSQNEVSETITAVSPGIELRFGQRSRASGRLSYEVAFTDYANESGPSAQLGRGGGEFRYDNGRTAVDARATYQQVEQGTRDIASVTGNSLLRRTESSVDVSGETALSAKSSVQTGISMDWTRYKRPGLVGGTNITVPVKVYIAARPKLSVSTGISFDRYRPQGEGEGASGAFYNVGLRGNLTGKLGSNFNFGYRTRDFARGVSEGFWGFDGSFDYQATAKTALTLALSRDFLSGASGESLRTSSYALNFATAPSLQWQFAGGVSYRAIDYGARVFIAAPGLPIDSNREDTYWDFNLNATYIVNSWMRITTAWSQRRNQSNETAFDFTSSVFSFLVGFQF